MGGLAFGRLDGLSQRYPNIAGKFIKGGTEWVNANLEERFTEEKYPPDTMGLPSQHSFEKGYCYHGKLQERERH